MINDKRYSTPYQNLAIEGKSDVEFFKLQLKNFQNKLAVRAFCDLQECETIEETIGLLKNLVAVAQIHQKHLERMANSEYKAYLRQLGINCENPQGTEERAGLTDQKPPLLKRQVTWIAQG